MVENYAYVTLLYPNKNGDCTYLDGAILTALYMMYRHNAEQAFNAYGLLGAGISAASRDTYQEPKYLSNNPYVEDALNKQAGAKANTLLRGLAGFIAPYIASAHYQNRMMQGYPVGVTGRTIANNPGKIGIVTGLAAMNPGAFAKGSGTFAKEIMHGFKNFFKD